MTRLAAISITDGSVVFSLALLAPRGGLTIPRNMISAETIEAPATGLEDLLTGSNISHRRAACRGMSLLTIGALSIRISGTRKQGGSSVMYSFLTSSGRLRIRSLSGCQFLLKGGK